MKAMVVKGPYQAAPGSGEVLIKVDTVGICGTDMMPVPGSEANNGWYFGAPGIAYAVKVRPRTKTPL